VPRPPGPPRAPAPPATGFLDFKGRIQGPATSPTWNFTLDGRQIHSPQTPLHPGTLRVAASGSPGRLHLERILWESADGKIQGEGAWTTRGGTSVSLTAEGVSLAPAAVYARAPMLQGLTGRFTLAGSMPSAPWALPDLEKIECTGSGQFLKDGQRVGAVDFNIADKHLRASSLELDLPEAGFRGHASAVLAKAGLSSLEAEGDVRTDAKDVSNALYAWKVPKTKLDMSGQTLAHATFQWGGPEGIHLDGHVEVEGPRWHGAHADRIRADVTIRNDVLRITDIALEKGEGHGSGDIWITWAPGPEDAEGIDMCFSAFRLPILEGLKAADQGDLSISGTGSGWARLHGPLGAIFLEGQAVAEDGLVYGIRIPAASANYSLDINSLRLRAQEVRVADTLDHLEGTEGPLSLSGSMDMDADRRTWTAELRGLADSTILGLPGPALQGRVAGRVGGPLTAPLGPAQAPEGSATLTQGRLTLGNTVLDGLQASLSFKDGRVLAEAGFPDKAKPVVALEAIQAGQDHLAADLRVLVSPETSDAAGLIARTSPGFLKDLSLDYQGRGDWTPAGIRWSGRLQEFVGAFEGFQLVQGRPGTFDGDTKGLDLAMELEGRSVATGGAPSPQSTSMRLEGHAPFAPDGALDLRLEGAAELSNLKAILDHLVNPGQYSLLADMRPAGTATFKLNLAGKPLEPTLEGRLDLKDGRLSERTFPQSIEGVNFTAFFHGRDITIPQDAPLRGTLAQGALTAWGRSTWGFRGLTDYDFNATLEDFQFRDLPEGFEIQGGFSGSLRGNDRDGGLLRGSIRAKSMLYQAEINLRDLVMAGGLGGAGSAFTSLDPSDPLTRIELDLDLQLARPWEFDTNLLKLQGKPTGAFRIKGSLARPGLKGRMEFLPGGRLTNLIPAGDIVLERGSVEFPDPARFNPIVDFHGRVDVDPYLVNLDITGTMDALQWNSNSTPVLRQDEIFAILLDPSYVSKVGTTVGTQTQTSVNTGLFNQGTSLLGSLLLASSLERLRKTLTLDRINFAFTGGPNLSLTVEKNLQFLGRRTPLIYSYKQEGTQTTISGNVEWRFGNLVLQLGARQTQGTPQTTGDTENKSVQPSGEIRYTWTPK
jgi:hypothetical protein